MKNKSLYTPYFLELKQLFARAKKQKDPAGWLYDHKARTTLFMIEGLARLQTAITLDKKAKKLHKFSKKLEDILGQIDFYAVLIRELTKRRIAKKQLNYFHNKLNQQKSLLTETLITKDFYTDKLKDFELINWYPGTAHKIEQIHERINSELVASAAFFDQHRSGFTSLENQVHELRRNLRWISIYAMSLQGIVTLKKDSSTYKWEKELISSEARRLSYNKLPVKRGQRHPIVFNEKAFYALNACILELGNLKDQGMAMEALAKALKKTEDPKPRHALAEARKRLKYKDNEEVIMKKAHKLLHKFYDAYKIHLLIAPKGK